MAEVAYYTHPSSHAHDTGPGHPESIDRIRAIDAAMAQADEAAATEVEAATGDELRRVHSADYIDRVLALDGEQGQLDYETVISPGSVAAARYAAGACVGAARAVLSGSSRTAFCAMRPPGHHAERDRGMGFCIFNNVAVAAADAIEGSHLQRVAVFDPDVHHGNGTERIFYTRDDVLYVSIHRDGTGGASGIPFYPGTGAAGDRGAGAGMGYNVNLPLPAGADDGEFATAWRHALDVLRDYRPQLLLVSAGFDAHVLDPLGGMRVTSAGFAARYRELVAAMASAAVPMVVALEGGYSLQALAECVPSVVRALSKFDDAGT